MRHARGYMDIHMLEKAGMGGIAYAAESADDFHYLNLQAGRISILREDPTHFMRWAHHVKGLKMQESSPVKRQLFGEYCWDTLWMEATKCPYANLYVSQAQVMGFNESEQGITVAAKETAKLRMSLELFAQQDPELVKKVLEGKQAMPFVAPGSGKEIMLPEKYDYLIVATGHLEVKKPNALKDKNTNENCLIIDQYIRSAYDMINETATQATKENQIVILGSGLAALDPVVSIAERRLAGCKTPEDRRQAIAEMPDFILCSRHANRHFNYKPDHQHRAFNVSRPAILDNETITLQQLETAFPAIWETAMKEIRSQDAAAIFKNPKLIHERVMKAMEPYVAELGTKMPNEEVHKGFDKWGSLITSSRIGVVLQIGNLIHELEQAGKLEFRKCELKEYSQGIATFETWEAGKPTGETTNIEPLLLVNSIGRNFNYADTTNSFWNNVDRLAHRKTRMGVELDEQSRLLHSDGITPYERVYCSGVMCIGDEIQRHGRLGAFSQSQGPIKTRSTEIAGRINFEISNPPPEVVQYFDFVRQKKGDMTAFLATLPELQGQPLSKECRIALRRLEGIMHRNVGHMTEHLYAENIDKSPSVVLHNLERTIGEHSIIPELAERHQVPAQERRILACAMHILMEKHIAESIKRCCDVTKDPSTITASVLGR
jgi:hypothetical protein